MDKFTHEHLASILPDDLVQFQLDAFCLYAECNLTKIGCSGGGSLIVKSWNDVTQKWDIFSFVGSEQAIEKYKQLVMDKE